MPNSSDKKFISLINQNLGIAHKVSQIYFDDPDSRDDVIQEMMYQLWKAYPSFNQKSKFSTWMYRVCLNTALTHLKKQKRSKNEPLYEAHYLVADEQSASEVEQFRLLEKAITTLSTLNKAIILLYLDGCSYDDISEVTGLSKSNVSVRLVRIRKELEQKLRDDINQ
jgi:RNA polymerase sigma factor (sigma-70 family)